jgi:hypothetical protein
VPLTGESAKGYRELLEEADAIVERIRDRARVFENLFVNLLPNRMKLKWAPAVCTVLHGEPCITRL